MEACEAMHANKHQIMNDQYPIFQNLSVLSPADFRCERCAGRCLRLVFESLVATLRLVIGAVKLKTRAIRQRQEEQVLYVTTYIEKNKEQMD
jgi:hypothetical protein